MEKYFKKSSACRLYFNHKSGGSPWRLKGRKERYARTNPEASGYSNIQGQRDEQEATKENEESG